MCEIIFEEF